ncbi:MAG: hypothetical protein ACPGVZ_05875 [Myxococcota bacterium]
MCFTLGAVATFLLTQTSCGESSITEAPSLAEAFAIDEPLDRARALDRALQGMTLSDIAEVEASADAARARLDHASGAILALWWARHDPSSAYDDGLPHFWLDGPTWASIVVREWARTAPSDAIPAVQRALEVQGGSNWPRTLSLAVVRGWFDVPDRDVSPLLDFVDTLPEGRTKKEALDLLIGRAITTRSTDEAIAFVEGLPNFDTIGPSALKQDAFSRLATQLAARDPDRALAWAQRHSSSHFGDGLFVRIARRWARTDAPAALAWAESLAAASPAHASKDRILTAIFRSWNSVDPKSAAAFLDARPLDVEWKPLFQMSVTHQAQAGAGEAALARIAAKTGAGVGAEFRDELIVSAVRAWRKRDESAAEAWIANAGLEPAVLRAIRTPIGPRGRSAR